MVDGGLSAGKAFSDEYRANRYHQPADEWEASWTFTGLPRDLQLLYTVGSELANSERRPTRRTDTAVRAARGPRPGARQYSPQRLAPSPARAGAGWGGVLLAQPDRTGRACVKRVYVRVDPLGTRTN